MGMYTGLRVKCVVKPEFREAIAPIAESGAWKESGVVEFRNFGLLPRADWIPTSGLYYMPDSWDGNDEYDIEYSTESGYWAFDCSIKNYNGEIEAFIKLMPLFVERLDYCETLYEDSARSRLYSLVDGVVVTTGSVSYYWNGEEVISDGYE